MDLSTRTDWQAIGTHAWRLEPPDIVHLYIVGDISGEDVSQILAVFHRCYQERGSFFALVNLSRMGVLSPLARKTRAFTRVQLVFRKVLVGGSFSQRAILKLVDMAQRLINNGTDNFPVVFFDEEATARTWIDQQRQAPPIPPES